MKVVLGALARTGLESRAGADLPAAVNAALVYYAGKLESGRGVAKFPKFLAEQGIGGQAPERQGDVELEVDVDPRIVVKLEKEAAAQGVDSAVLARHAVLIYLAGLDLIGDPRRTPEQRVHA